MADRKAKSVYSVHPGVLIAQKWVATLKEKTGRSLEEWLALVKRSGPTGDREVREWLKKEHGLGTNSAGWLADHAAGKTEATDAPDTYLKAAEGYIEEMFGGGRAALRPIYDELLSLGLSLGQDVKVCPCQTIVPFYRNHVFAQVKPTTRTRIDLGFAFGAMKAEGRLIDTGGYAKKDRITHRIPITAVAEIDGEVKRWFRAAYDGDA